MRLLVIAIGRLKQGPERELAERYRERFESLSRKLGFRGLDIHEIPESRHADAAGRIAEEAQAMIAHIPDGAMVLAFNGPMKRVMAGEELLLGVDGRAIPTDYNAQTKTLSGPEGALVRIDLPALPSDIDTVLATTLREGVTNILRHSKVQCCNIAATRTAVGIRLEVANDGVVDRDEGDEHRSGSGLGNLRGRLGAFGGTLRAGVEGEAAGRWFRLVADIPWDGGPTSSGGVDARRTDQAAAG